MREGAVSDIFIPEFDRLLCKVIKDYIQNATSPMTLKIAQRVFLPFYSA